MSALMRREPQGAPEINQLHNNRKGAEMEEKKDYYNRCGTSRGDRNSGIDVCGRA